MLFTIGSLLKSYTFNIIHDDEFCFYLDESSRSLIEISKDYDTDYVRQSLREFGHPPGPLVPSTKQVYVRQLTRLLQRQTELKDDDKHINSSSGIMFIVIAYL